MRPLLNRAAISIPNPARFLTTESPARPLALAAVLILVVASVGVSPVLGQTFTVEGRGEPGEYVELPQPLTTGTWLIELEAYGQATYGRFLYAPFTLLPSRHVGFSETVASAKGPWRKSLAVSKRGFPAGSATLHQGENVPAGSGVAWTIRFTKDGSPKLLPPPDAWFTVFGRGSPEKPLALRPAHSRLVSGASS